MPHLELLKAGITVLSMLSNQSYAKPAGTALELIRQLSGAKPEKHAAGALHCDVCHEAAAKLAHH